MDKPRILFIEDDAFLCRIYTKALEDNAYDVILSTSAEDGLKHLERVKPDLILLDVLLPHMDGFEFLEHIKQSADFKDIPVLFITNLSNREDVERANQLGAAGFLIKAHTLPADAVRKIESLLK